MTNDKKILFFDIDGTLITDDGKRYLPDSAKEAIAKARSLGHLTFINTGRVFVNVEDFIRDVGFDGFVCGCGTNIIVDGRELYHHRLDPTVCRAVAKKARECKMLAIYEYAGHTGFDKAFLFDNEENRELKEKGHLDILYYFMDMKRKLVDDIESDEFVFDKFTSWYEPGNPKLDEFKKYISEWFYVIDREGNFCENIPIGFSKATGIKYLLDYYRLPAENAFVFGDSNNDLEMLECVPNSIAMGKCTDEVLRIAGYHTDTVENDGIYKAMKHFGII